MIRSLIFRFFFITWTVVMPILALPLALLGQKSAGKVARLWADVAIRMMKLFCDVTVEVIGRENIPAAPYIVASKHQSAFETIYFFCIFDNPAFVLKKELLWLPVYGFYLLLLEMVWIDRSKGIRAIKKIITSSRLLLSKGRPLVIFPEGTRVPVGQEAEFLPGISAISRDMPETPIVPIALNSGVFMPKKGILIKPGVIVIQILPAIIGYNKTLVADLKSQINKVSDELAHP